MCAIKRKKACTHFGFLSLSRQLRGDIGLLRAKKGLTSAVEYNMNAIMNIQIRIILTTAPLAFALATWFSNEVSADELREAQVTQVIQDITVISSGAAPRPAAVNDDIRQGPPVQVCIQSRRT